jgi:ProP effector
MLPTSNLPAPDPLPPESLIPEAVPATLSPDHAPTNAPADATHTADLPEPQEDSAVPTVATEAATAAAAAMSPAACAAQLKQLFPALFTGVAKPLKLRIQADIQTRVPGLFTKQLLSVVLRRYTGSHSYLVVLTQATHRFDLDGAPAGELSAEHKQAAMDELTLRRTTQRDAQRGDQKSDQRNDQRNEQRNDQRETQRKLQIDQRQEHQARQEQQERLALEEQKRRNRATLLRDFENTTLTPANFSVLKGITVQAMEGYLATARQEALALRVAQPQASRDVASDAAREAPRAPNRAHPSEPRGDRTRTEGRPNPAPRGPRR